MSKDSNMGVKVHGMRVLALREHAGKQQQWKVEQLSADPPYLTVGTEVSAKYKGAFCEAKIKKCQKAVKCKVSPRDGGPQISVTDDSIQGELKIGALVKVRQPDSGQLIDGNVSRIIDSSIYTVVFDDGDIATLKRTQICLKGDKHYMESDTLDRLPLTNPEHFSTPVNLLKTQTRRRRAHHSSPSGTVSDYSDDDSESVTSTSRRISPRGSRSSGDLIGKVISLEVGDKKRWCPALVIRPSNHELDMKNKAIIMVKSFKDGKITTLHERQVKDFNKDAIKSYSDDKLTKQAVDKAQKYVSTKELPASWKREEILGTPVTQQTGGSGSRSSTALPHGDSGDDTDTSSDGEHEEKSDMFVAQLYKFMDDRSTPINKPAQLYNRDVNLSRLYRKVRKFGGFTKVSAIGKWKDVANKLGFTGISAGTEMKLLYRRYLVAYEEFHRKMGDTHMFEGSRSQSRRQVAGGRNVMPPRDREALHLHSGIASPNEQKNYVIQTSASLKTSAAASKDSVSSDKKTSVSPASTASAAASSSGVGKSNKCEQSTVTQTEELLRRTPSRQASVSSLSTKVAAGVAGEVKPATKTSNRTDSPKPPDSPAGNSRASRGRPGSAAGKTNIKIEKSAKLDLDPELDKPTVLPTGSGRKSASPVPPSTAKAVGKKVAKASEEVDIKAEEESLVSEEEYLTVNVEVDYPPGTKLKVRYGRARNIKIYDAKVMEVTVGDNGQVIYSVHYSGWNIRYDEKITTDRIVGASGKCEKKMMEIYREGFGPGARGKRGKITVQPGTQAINSASSSTGSRTPEPREPLHPPSAKSAPRSTNSKTSVASTGATPQGQSRATRSSVSDVSLTRPTRSKSTDSSLSSGLPTRKQRAKRGSIVDAEIKQEPNEQEDLDETTEEECSIAEEDHQTKAVMSNEGGVDTQPASVSEPIVSEAKPDVRTATPTSEHTDPAGDEHSTGSERTPRRTARRQTSRHTPSAASVTTSSTTVTMITQSGSASAASCDSPPSKRAKKSEETGEQPIDEATVVSPEMDSDARNRMQDIIDRVAGGDISTNTDDVILDHEVITTAESDESGDETSPPPTKRKKIEKEDSSESVACEGAFVKIEPLKHKKAQAKQARGQDSSAKQVSDDEDEADDIQTPPLIKKPENRGGRSPAHTDDSSRPDSEQSTLSDYQSTCTSSNPTTKSHSAAVTSDHKTSNTTISDSATSNLSMLSEQAGLSKADTRVRSRTSARRQQAKRSPRPKHSGMDSGSEMYPDDNNSTMDQEVYNITSSSGISPNKGIRSAVSNTAVGPPRPPRQPKHNFKIEEELAEIEDQDLRITYLVDKLAEIRNLYSDVKSNLASIERKRKRVRLRDREHPNTSLTVYCS